MVTFEDLNDPTSVKSVDPRDLSATFGEGVGLQTIAYKVTDERITWKVREYLPWLESRKSIRGYLGGSENKLFEDPTGLYLNGIEFSRGENQK